MLLAEACNSSSDRVALRDPGPNRGPYPPRQSIPASVGSAHAPQQGRRGADVRVPPPSRMRTGRHHRRCAWRRRVIRLKEFMAQTGLAGRRRPAGTKTKCSPTSRRARASAPAASTGSLWSAGPRTRTSRDNFRSGGEVDARPRAGSASAPTITCDTERRQAAPRPRVARCCSRWSRPRDTERRQAAPRPLPCLIGVSTRLQRHGEGSTRAENRVRRCRGHIDGRGRSTAVSVFGVAQNPGPCGSAER